MTGGFTEADLVEIASLVLADIATSGVALDLVLYDGRSGTGSSPEAHRLIHGDIGDTDDLFAQADGHWMRVSATAVQDAAAIILSQLQDDVIDSLGRGWPEITNADGTFAGVAVPQSEPAAPEPGWYVSSRQVSAIGQLAHNT